MVHNAGVTKKLESASKEGKALNPLQEAIKFLEELQECQKRPTRFGNRDTQYLLDGALDRVTDGLKQLQIDLENENDSGGGRSRK